MKTNTCKPAALLSGIILLLMLTAIGCNPSIERKGVVLSQEDGKPLPGVRIDIYLKSVSDDSLAVPVFTDSNGHFHITEKRGKNQDFLLDKEGYVGVVSTLGKGFDTVYMERLPAAE